MRSLASAARTSLRSRPPPAIIQNAVWLHLRLTLGFWNVEDLIAERGPACLRVGTKRNDDGSLGVWSAESLMKGSTKC